MGDTLGSRGFGWGETKGLVILEVLHWLNVFLSTFSFIIANLGKLMIKMQTIIIVFIVEIVESTHHFFRTEWKPICATAWLT